MAAAALKIADVIAPPRPRAAAPRLRLAELATLGDTDIGIVADLSADLHSLFDPVADGTLPIYFGPLLGRLYLEGL